MKVQLTIRRFNPETDKKPWWGKYEVDAEPTDRVLDTLHYVKWYQDGTLTLRRSCAHGICGSDGMRINGQNALACKVLMKDVATAGATVTVEPLLGLKLVKDLVVDMDPFFDHYRSVMPYLVNNDPAPADGRERLQSPEARERFDKGTWCILCACCTTSCPSFWWNPETFVGPAGLLQAYRFIADSRDEATSARLDNLEDPYRLYRCRGIMNCVDACPKGLNPTAAIGRIRSLLVKRRV